MSGEDVDLGEYPTGSKGWTKLSPRARNAGMGSSLRAAVDDPLWLLGRQWQVGEFRGEDAGSPVDASVTVEHDDVTRVQLGEDPPVDYDHRVDGPLETLVEREPVVTDEEPPGLQHRAEAGQYFLRLLAAEGVSVGATDFPAALLLVAPDEPLPADDARYVDLMAGRALDGHAVFEAAVDGTLSRPSGVDSSAFEAAAASYVDWYRGLYDEPTEAVGRAWDPERFEYSFSVATGSGEGETVFSAEEYPGGRLDWYAFSPEGGSLADDGAGTTTESDDATAPEPTEFDRLPTAIGFPGMPAARWWELEDSSVNLEALTAAPEGLSRLLMLEFVLVFGNDWFMIPIETPVGTLSRVTTLSVTDTFGVTTHDVPAAEDDGWNMFMADLGTESDGPGKGLFLPPVFGEVAESDPVEQVVLTRDEMANLAFGVEECVESPVGSRLDRESFHAPGLSVSSMRPGESAEREGVVLENTGSVELDAEGWSVAVVDDGGEVLDRFSLPQISIPPGASVTLGTGRPPGDPAGDGDGGAARADVYWGRADPALGDSRAVHLLVERSPGDVVERVRIPPLDGSLLPAYRLANRVPDHWFPLKPTGPDDDREYRYRLARLLDVDAFGADVTDIPVPLGKILGDSADVDIYEEEVTRAGVELTRSYQLARWVTGSTHLWSGRRARTGRGEGSSGLRFDLLED